LKCPDNIPARFVLICGATKLTSFPMKTGDEVTVSFDLESRDFNGKWYTDVKAWKVESISKRQFK